MKRVFYDLKRNMTYLILFSILSFIMISFFWQRDISKYDVSMFNYYFFGVNYLGMLYIISRLYIEDFKTGAIKNLYVATLSNIKILKIRMISSISVGFIFFLLSQINVIISYEKLGKVFEVVKLLKLSFFMMCIYCLVAILIASYVGLISHAISNNRRAYIIAMFPPLLLHYFLPFILFLNQSKGNFYLNKMLQYIPNGLIIRWTNTWEISLLQFIIFLMWVFVFFVATILIANHKDLSN